MRACVATLFHVQKYFTSIHYDIVLIRPAQLFFVVVGFNILRWAQTSFPCLISFPLSQSPPPPPINEGLIDWDPYLLISIPSAVVWHSAYQDAESSERKRKIMCWKIYYQPGNLWYLGGGTSMVMFGHIPRDIMGGTPLRNNGQINYTLLFCGGAGHSLS